MLYLNFNNIYTMLYLNFNNIYTMLYLNFKILYQIVPVLSNSSKTSWQQFQTYKQVCVCITV